MTTVDLNADLGEECGDDAAMLTIVSSANIACGMHAGNLAEMVRVLALADATGVQVGAHPSYPDRANFGRVSMAEEIDDHQFTRMLRAQLGAFQSLHDGWMPYVKAHGALYNDASVIPGVAHRLVTAVERGTAIMHQPNTWVHHYAEERHVPFIAEVFADRGYLSDGTLVPRQRDGAVLHDPEVIAERVVRMVTQHTVEAIDGTVHEFSHVDSVCVHGDTPGAVLIARTVRAALESAGVTVAPASLLPATR